MSYIVQAKAKLYLYSGNSTNAEKILALMIKLSTIQPKMPVNLIVRLVEHKYKIKGNLCRKVLSELIKIGVISKESNVYTVN